MAMAPDWSELPKDLLHQISLRFDSDLYLLRFRSVCSSWRSSSSSSIPNHPPLPTNFTIISNTDNQPSTFSLSNCTLFLIYPPQQQRQQTLHPWLVKFGQDSIGRAHLWHPLSRFPIKYFFPFETNFNQVLDLYQLPIFDLGPEFVLTDITPRSFNNLFMEKVVFLWLDAGFVLLTIHVSGKLALFRSGDEAWTIIPEMPTPYDDVCVFKGRLFAVDNTGRTVVVGLDSSVGLVAEPVFGGDKKFLLECDGELLLVDKYLSSDYFCSLDDDDGGDGTDLVWERAVRFDVFRLEEEKGKKEWVELKSLEDWVLFLGDDCAFSVSVSNLRVGKGSCVIFRDGTVDTSDLESGIGVFHLDEGRIMSLSDCRDYSKLFWPPPDWVRWQY